MTKLIIDNEGFLGVGGVANPAFPIEHTSGARLTAGGVWTDASSRSFKQDITELDAAEAVETLNDLTPVKYAYKTEPNDQHVGFIAEDVPSVVATPDRKGLAPMDIVGVLTKVVKEQQKTIEQLNERLAQLEANAKK